LVSVLGILIVAVVAIILGIVLFNWSYRTVGAGEVGIVLEWNAPKYQVGEGLQIINPIVQSLAVMNVKTQLVTVDAAAASRDLQNVVANIALNYRLDSSKALEIYKTVGTNYPSVLIAPAIQEVVKQVTAGYTASELVTKRDAVKTQIQDTLKDRLKSRGIIVEQVNIVNIEFSKQFTDAIEQSVVVKQKEQQAQNQLRVTQIEAQKQVIESQAAYNATIINAKANADKVMINANATANSIKLINLAIKENPKYMDFIQSNRWNGQLPMIIGGEAATNGIGGIILDSKTLNEYSGNKSAPVNVTS